ncbi:nicotinamide riboside transporter PnuC [Novosphingobium aerophilum]|uniref:Nicotinamide riboside transporter PnuC n=1 Tax=Novosphingobium aerophilum TaxID=2839843 RepID=A0A7X1KBV3_9SPHN|nr:nicotinamide riboside transporter PnuC [Novosphingobium aerophilum]MBC2651457.1 nicotinamide mononucleotide transporter [Novosphingobium aerophilum]
MNPIEWLAAALGVANIALLVRRSVWNFAFGMAMVALYLVVFWEARLYGEAGLQVFFFAAQGWGWWLWVRAGGEESRVPVRWLSPLSRMVWIVATAALSLNLGWVMHRFTDAALPYADSAITGASIAAQILLGLRRVENWILWILIDLASIAVYLTKGLHPTAGLYVLFLALSVMGLREWVQAAGRPTR